MIFCLIGSDTMKDAHIKAPSELQKGEKQTANLTLGGYAEEDGNRIISAITHAAASVQLPLNFLLLSRHCCPGCAKPASPQYAQTPAP